MEYCRTPPDSELRRTQDLTIAPSRLELREPASPLRRQSHATGPAVGGMAQAGHEAPLFEQREHRAHGVRIRRDPPHQVLLRDGISFRKRRQEDKLVGGHAVPSKVGVHLAMKRQVGRSEGHRDVVSRRHVTSQLCYVYGQKANAKLIEGRVRVQ